MKDRAVRIHHEKRVIKNRLDLIKKTEIGSLKDKDGKTAYEKALESPHKFAKQHPKDCGCSNCGVCRCPEKEFRKAQKRKVKPIELDE